MKLPWRKRTFELPQELYANPITEIRITPRWYSLQEDVISFIEQICEGYLWEVKFGTAFIAVHDERYEVERILHHIQSLKHRHHEGRWVPNDAEEYALLLIDFARIVPRMWD